MFSHAFGALRRPRRGYVCLNCLLKDIVNTPPKRRRRNYSTQNAALQDSVLQDCPNGKSALSTRGSSLDPIHLSVESKDRLVKQLEPLDTLQLNHATTSSPNEPKSRANIIENQQASNITLSTPGDNRQNANNHRHGHFKKKNSQEVAHSMGEGKNKNMNRGSKRSRVKTKLMEGKRNATQTSKDSLNAHKNVSKTDPRAKKSSPLRQSIGSMSSAIYAKEEASDSKPSLLIKVLSKKKREPSGIESGIVKKKKTKGLKKGRSPAQERSSERKQKAPGKDKMGSASITGATGKLSISKALSILSSSKKLSSGRGTGESSKILATKLSRPSSKKPSKRDNSSLIITSPVVGGKAFRAGTVGEHLSLEASLGKDSSFSLTNKLEVHSIEASNLEIEPIFTEEGPAVPGLAYGLDRVLFNPGVYQLQDPRSRVYNFDPYLQKIMPVAEFNFSSLQKYITSSKDVVLQSVAQRYGKRYTGSSSSMTSTLAHFHFLLSQWRSPNFSMLSESFPKASKNFTLLQRGPSAAFLRWNGSGYAIDADKEYDTPNVLSMLGKSMEKLLTLETNDFERYRRTNATQISEDEKSAPEAFHYSSMGDFLMRSQLDAYDHRLPGTGMFDLKTRAVVSIRMDVENFEEGMGYEIRQLHGNYESFEREYYDMIRAAFLKYSLQVRMGRMDGIFVAYHNTERIFGFQYVSLPEMDLSLHGTADTLLGDQEFKISVELLNKVLDRVTAKFPQQSVRLHFETRETSTPFMYIFAEPMSEERIERIQNKSQLATQEFERKFFNLDHEKSEGHLSVERPGEDTLLETDWETLRAKVEEEVEMDGRFPNREVVESEDTGLRPKITLGEDPTNSNPKVASLVDLEAMESNSSTLDNAKTTGSEEQADLESEATAGKEAPANTDVDGPIRKEAGSSTRDVATLKMENQDLRALENDNYSSKHAPEKGLQGYTYTDKISAGTVPAVQNKKLPDSKAEGKDLAGNNSKESLHQGSTPDLFAMTLTVRNRVNGRYVDRPVDLRKGDKWAAEYSLAEVQGVGRSWSLYTASKLRREKALRSNNKDEKQAVSFYTARLRELAQKGKQWRIERDRMDEDKKRSIL